MSQLDSSEPGPCPWRSPALIYTCLYELGLGHSLLSLLDGARTGSETLLNAGFPIVSSTLKFVDIQYSYSQLPPTIVICILFTSVQAVLFRFHHSWDHRSGDSRFL